MTVSMGPARWAALRSALATVEIMAGVTLAHSWAGGALPSLPWLIGLAGLVYGASLVALRGRTDLRVLVLGLGLAQLALHGFLSWLAPDAHVHAVHVLQDRSGLDLTWQMAAAHAASAVLTALVWRARSRAIEVLLTWRTAVPVPVPAPRSALASTARVLPRARTWLSSAPRRGLPAAPCRA
jgi:hypothetical protein